MSKLLDMVNDDEQEFTVTLTDTDGVKTVGELLDIVCYNAAEYAVILPRDEEEIVDIFRILPDAEKEAYARVTDGDTAEAVFELFRIKNEDEYDFF